MKKVSLTEIRKAVYRCIGSKVVVKASKGRHKFDVNEGVIKEAYPHIFMIQLKDKIEEEGRMVSYTYSDILTKEVQLSICA